MWLVCRHSAVAQKVVTVDAGAGMKQEMVYDASGKVVEIRTFGADGKLQVRNTYKFGPGAISANNHTTINYFPDGKVRMSVVEDTDENANFLRDVQAGYDESGRQVSGHKMSHDPFTGIYRCANWDTPKQKYVEIECPAGEEEGGEPEPLKALTQEQAVQQLATARQKAAAQEKAARVQPKAPTPLANPNTHADVALVLPALLSPGGRVSGSLTVEPEKYENIAGLSVSRLTLPSSAAHFAFAEWTVVAPGEKPQRAGAPFAFTVPASGSDFGITLQQAGDPAVAMSKRFKISGSSAKLKTPPSYSAPAVCTKDDVCTVAGKFDGDATTTFAAFDTHPATVIAETAAAAYIEVPDEALTQPQYLLVNEQSKLLAFPLSVAELELRADKWDVKAGENLLIHVTLTGPGEMADNLWRAGNYPAGNLQRVRALAPDYQLPKETREQHEEREKREKLEKPSKPEEGKEGVVVLAIRNLAPDVVSFRDSKNEVYTFSLTPESFKMGPFQYHIVVVPSKDGVFSARSAVVPFLAPVSPQVFQVSQEQAAK